MLRIWLMAILAAAVLFTVEHQDVLHRAGLIGYCTTTTAPPGAKGSWRACEKGKLDGRPDLCSSTECFDRPCLVFPQAMFFTPRQQSESIAA